MAIYGRDTSTMDIHGRIRHPKNEFLDKETYKKTLFGEKIIQQKRPSGEDAINKDDVLDKNSPRNAHSWRAGAGETIAKYYQTPHFH